MVLPIEECVLLVEHIFREGNRYTDLVQKQLAEKFPETPEPHRNAVRSLTVKFRETFSVLEAERSGRHLNLTMRSFWTFLTQFCGVHQNHGASWHKRKASGLQQRIKRSENN
jgi:hypothetical protein